ncbi:MAG TPA: hypothetical protein DCO89_00465 [Clostridiales bacterium]|nr:hypothetical protein [Clostridiales bacterium]
MSKANNKFLNGAITLILCSLLAKIIGAIYKIPLLKTLQSDGLGKFQMVISVYALFLVISSSGLVVTLSKVISKEVAYKNTHNQKKYLTAGLLISIIISSFLALIMIAISPILSKYQSFYNLQYSFIAISPAIIFSSLIAVLRGYFLGKRKMIYSGSVQIIEAIFKLILSLYLSIKFSANGGVGAVFGAVLGITFSELISLLFLFCLFLISKKRSAKLQNRFNTVLKINFNNFEIANKKTKKKPAFNKKSINFFKKIKISASKQDNFIDTRNRNFHCKTRYKSLIEAIKETISISFFVTLQACVLPLIGAIDGLVVVPLLLKSGLSQSIAYSLFGIEDGVVSAILSMPTIIASSVSSAIIPNIKTQKNYADLIKNAFKIVWLISIFCATIFIFFSSDITNFLYGSGLNSKTINELAISSDMLRINGFNIIYISLLSLSSGVLQGLDRSVVPVKNLFIATILRFIVLLVCLTSSVINIYGLAIADMSFYACAMLLNIKKIKEITNVAYNVKHMFILPSISLFAMTLLMYFVKNLLSGILTFRIVTLCVMISGGVLYLALLYFTKTLNMGDIISLRKKTSANK